MVSPHKTLANPIVSPWSSLLSEVFAGPRDLTGFLKKCQKLSRILKYDSVEELGILTSDIGDNIHGFLSRKCS